MIYTLFIQDSLSDHLHTDNLMPDIEVQVRVLH
jgi:hypothetical protein